MEDTITTAIRKMIREEVREAVLRELGSFQKHVEAPAPAVCSCMVGSHDGYEMTWTTKQVAEFLGIRPQTVSNKVSLNEPGFPRPRKFGRKNAYIPSEVAAYRGRILGLEAVTYKSVAPNK